jgi:hypothetical protein
VPKLERGPRSRFIFLAVIFESFRTLAEETGASSMATTLPIRLASRIRVTPASVDA